MDLFLHCQRKKTHVYIDVSEHATVETIQKHIKQLLNLTENPRIKMRKKEAEDVWMPLDSDVKFKDVGINKETAKAEDPFKLAFLLPADDDKVELVELDNPKPINELTGAAA